MKADGLGGTRLERPQETVPSPTRVTAQESAEGPSPSRAEDEFGQPPGAAPVALEALDGTQARRFGPVLHERHKALVAERARNHLEDPALLSLNATLHGPATDYKIKRPWRGEPRTDPGYVDELRSAGPALERSFGALPPGARILDIGMGSGRAWAQLADEVERRGLQVVGLNLTKPYGFSRELDQRIEQRPQTWQHVLSAVEEVDPTDLGQFSLALDIGASLTYSHRPDVVMESIGALMHPGAELFIFTIADTFRLYPDLEAYISSHPDTMATGRLASKGRPENLYPDWDTYRRQYRYPQDVALPPAGEGPFVPHRGSYELPMTLDPLEWFRAIEGFQLLDSSFALDTGSVPRSVRYLGLHLARTEEPVVAPPLWAIPQSFTYYAWPSRCYALNPPVSNAPF